MRCSESSSARWPVSLIRLHGPLRPFGGCCLLRRPTLGAGMEVEVGRQPQVEPRPAGKQPRGEVERDAVDEVAQHEAAARVAMRHERQRREEVLAELAVRRPWLGRLGDFEAEAVDEDRPPGVELDVVGARVAQPHSRVERARLDLEGQERGLLELREGPLVGIRDELDRPRDG